MTTSKDPIEREFQEYLELYMRCAQHEALRQFCFEGNSALLEDADDSTLMAVYQRLEANL